MNKSLRLRFPGSRFFFSFGLCAAAGSTNSGYGSCGFSFIASTAAA